MINKLVLFLIFVNLLVTIDGIAKPTNIFENPWSWKDEHGGALQLGKWKGLPLVVGMNYTSCHLACPLMIRQLKALQSELKPSTQIVFVTLDPWKDTPRRLMKFKQQWKVAEDSWHFLSGSEEATQQLAKWLGIKFQELDSHIIHDNKIIILNEAGEIIKTLQGWDSISKDQLQ